MAVSMENTGYVFKKVFLVMLILYIGEGLLNLENVIKIKYSNKFF